MESFLSSQCVYGVKIKHHCESKRIYSLSANAGNARRAEGVLILLDSAMFHPAFRLEESETSSSLIWRLPINPEQARQKSY